MNTRKVVNAARNATMLVVFTFVMSAHRSLRAEEQKTAATEAKTAAFTTITLTVTDKGETRVNGKAPLYAETFVFDEKTGMAKVAEGTELNPVGGYPVPLRITSMGYNFSGSFSAVYTNVVLDCAQLPADNRVKYLASVDVQKGFSYDVKINTTGHDKVFIAADHSVSPGDNVSPRLKEPSVDLLITVTEIGKGEKEGKPLRGAVVTIERAGARRETLSTDASGVVKRTLSRLQENIISLQVEHPQKKTLTRKYSVPITLRGAATGLVLYDIPLHFHTEDSQTGRE